jgi:hypothetical protein
MHDTERVQAPTMGERGQMRVLRLMVLAIIATLALGGGIATATDGNDGPPGIYRSDVPSTGPGALDPIDPEHPPDAGK